MLITITLFKQINTCISIVFYQALYDCRNIANTNNAQSHTNGLCITFTQAAWFRLYAYVIFRSVCVTFIVVSLTEYTEKNDGFKDAYKSKNYDATAATHTGEYEFRTHLWQWMDRMRLLTYVCVCVCLFGTMYVYMSLLMCCCCCFCF